MTTAKGIIVEIGGDTSKLQEALKKVAPTASSLSKELKGVNSLLKLDPKNTELVAQKQQVLKENIEQTSKVLNTLKGTQDQVYQKWQNYIKQEPRIREVATTIDKTKEELKKLQEEQKKAQQQFEKGKITKQQYEQINNKLKECKINLSELRKEQKKLNDTTVSTEAYRDYKREVELAEIQLKELKAEASNWTTAGRSIEEFGNKITSTCEKVDKLGTTLTTRLTLPILGLVTAGIKYNAEIEQMTTAYETFLGSTEEADKVINQIKNNASKTPFDVTSLVKANQMLISTGENADNSQKTILALGDAITATGGGNDELTRMASNLQQIKNAGKATAMDIRQFAYAGIDVYGLLSDYMGKTTEEIKDMEISYKDLSGALQKASESGGKYYGAMDKASETLTGQTKQLKAEVKDMAGELTKSLMPTAKKVLKQAKDLIEKFDSLSDSEKENITNTILMVAAIGPAIKILGTLGKTTGTAVKGVGMFSQAVGLMGKTSTEAFKNASAGTQNLAKGLTFLTSSTGITIAAIAAVSAAVIYLATKESDAEKQHREFAEEMSNSRQSLEEYNKSIDDTTNANLSHINSVSNLKDELKTLVDENGKVKEGYESRASFILNELNEALGTEYELNGDIIQNYKDLQNELDNLIEKKKAEIQLNADEEKYKNAIENQEKAVNELKKAHDNLGMSIDEAKAKREELINSHLESADSNGGTYWESKQLKELDNLILAYEDAEWQVKDYTNKVNTYTDNYEKFVEGKYSEIGSIITTTTEDWSKKSLEEVRKSIEEQGKNLEAYKSIYENTGNKVALQLSQQAQQNLDNLTQELVKRTQTLTELGPQEIEAWKNIATQSYSSYSMELANMDEVPRKKIEDATGIIAAGTPEMQEKAEELGRKTVEEFDKSADSKQKALNVITSYLNGLSDEEKQELLKQAGIENADIVLDELDKGDISEENGRNILEGLWKGLKNNTWQGKILGVASGLAQAVNKAFTGKDGWDEHSPSKKMKKFAEYYIQPISDVMRSRQQGIVSDAKNLANKINSAFENKINMPQIQDFGKLQGNLSSEIINQTKTIFTTPQIVFNVQELDEANLQQCFNYINRKFGSHY